MQLGLSSAAAHDANIDALVDACARRGLGALELRAGDMHGVRADSTAEHIQAVRARAASAHIDIAGYWMAGAEGDPGLASLGQHLGAPIISAVDEPLAVRLDRARRIGVLGAHALVGVSGSASAWLSAVVHAGLDFAWEIDLGQYNPAADADAVLDAAGARLRYIRFVGGGPEAALQEGRGIGVLMGRLTLAGYAGPLVLTPSSARYRVAWAAWLGRRGGWGCGSRAEAADTVRLAPRLPALTVEGTTGEGR